MHRRKLLALEDHIIAVLIGQVQAPAASGFFKAATGFDSESEGFMDYTDDVLFD
jgi:hypothetical protein